MSAPEIYGGILDAFERREKRIRHRALFMAFVAVLPMMALYGYLVSRNLELVADNARLRDVCGVRAP